MPQLDIKRFYPEGLELETEKCPGCKTMVEFDNYLSYPVFNDPSEPEEVHFYCRECDEEWNVKYHITIKAEKITELKELVENKELLRNYNTDGENS
jgi:hypothetical protein